MNGILNEFVDANPMNYSVALLQLLAHPEQGGDGYTIEDMDTWTDLLDLDGWEVNKAQRKIVLDHRGVFGEHSDADRAVFLRHALETDFFGTREGLIARVGWGAGKVLLGSVEAVVGAIGIIVPEPGTTAGGVVVLTLGVNTVIDGVTQLSGANQGHGINILGEAFESAGSTLADLADFDPEVGARVGRGVFFVSSIALGAWGSLRVMHVPGKVGFSRAVGGRPGGVQIGRVDALYPSSRAGDGMTIFSINNNAGKSILRFVTHDGRLVVNGRIFGVRKVLKHEGDPKKVLKGLLELVAHGSKF